MAESHRISQSTFANIGILVTVVILMIALVEIVSGSLLDRIRPEEPTQEITPLYPIQSDVDLGYALTANTSHRAAKALADGTICYDVTYHTDQLGRRTLFQRYAAGNPHVILFGGSVTFGEGLADEDTLQFHLMQRLPNHDIYNYAVHGYGPSHMLAKLESRTLSREIASNQGAAVYVLIPSHISRVIGDSRAFWIHDGPYYHFDARDELIRNGSFVTGRSMTTRTYQWFGDLKARSSFLRLINMDLPISIRIDALGLTARVLIESHNEYSELFDGTFHVLFHPTWNLDVSETANQHRLLRSMLLEAGVSVLDQAEAGLRPDEVILPGCDLHPNGRLNERLASALARELAHGSEGSRSQSRAEAR
jgi:hypothetical protein